MPARSSRRLAILCLVASVTTGAGVFAALPAESRANERLITVASTTSTEQSGLFDHILPRFEEATGITVRVLSQGTGQALETGQRGDADVLFVHAEAAERAFVEAGYGVERHTVMANDFVIVGPSGDPAGIAGGDDAIAAFTAIADAEAAFVSRGDGSGTHRAEQAIWDAASIAPDGDWYRAVGSGMGPALTMAAEIPAYTLSDRGTWISFANRRDLAILVEDDPRLVNAYSVILVNPERHSHVRARDGQAFIDWLLSDAGQEAIASYRIDGEPLFHPNAEPLSEREN